MRYCQKQNGTNFSFAQKKNDIHLLRYCQKQNEILSKTKWHQMHQVSHKCEF